MRAALTNPARSLSYDPDGSTLSDAQAGSSTGYTATYGVQGHLATLTQGSSAGVEYTYDTMAHRIKRAQWTGSSTSARTITVYAYDQSHHLLGEYAADGTALTEYVWLGDTPVAVIKTAGAGMQLYAVHTDHLDTPRMLLDAAGNLRWRWMGEPFGAMPAEEQPTAGQPAVQHNLRFPGQEYEALGGKHYNYFRVYDPGLGRYVQSDPIGLAGGINTYAYVNGNPLMYMDPYGLWAWGDPLPDWLVDGAAGFGDTLSFGGTRVVRRWMGTDGAVNRCSIAYSNGEWGAIGLSLAFGGAHLGRNALNQMGRAGDLGTRVARGVGRVFSDGRSWGAVRDTWSVAAGNGERWLAANGQSLHHWLIPQRFAEVNAGFNYMAISAGFNSWMNGSTAFRTAVEWGFRGSVAGIYGAPLTAAVSRDDCTCQK
ncbi:RHS repeat-associated core domain-containing protein [Roseateles sp. BYS87W]|uniref:RHS repeat-associated core domain-containing protein n=1 Tax=Pelomonas baiyunensis TaxID=3299026 RepID=A0ABW7H292_9BURK